MEWSGDRLWGLKRKARMLLRGPWTICWLVLLCFGVLMSSGCIVRDRVTIVPRTQPPVQTDAPVDDEPARPTTGRIGTNAVLPEALPEGTDVPASEPDVAVADADTDADADVMPDAVAVSDADEEPEPAPDAQPDAATPPQDEPDEVTAAIDPPLEAAWGEGSAYNRLFRVAGDPATLSGTIDAVGTFIPAADASPGLMLDLQRGDEVVQIHVAPLRYLRAVGLRFDFGESLTVTGRWATIDGQRVLLAQSITRGETVIALRNAATGRPTWVNPPAPQDNSEAENAPAPPAEDGGSDATPPSS